MKKLLYIKKKKPHTTWLYTKLTSKSADQFVKGIRGYLKKCCGQIHHDIDDVTVV